MTSSPNTLCSTSTRPLSKRHLRGSPSLTTPSKRATSPSICVSFTLLSVLTTRKDSRLGVMTAVFPAPSTEGRARSQEAHSTCLLGNQNPPECCRVASVRPAQTTLLPSSMQDPSPEFKSQTQKSQLRSLLRASAFLRESVKITPHLHFAKATPTGQDGLRGVGDTMSGPSQLPNSRAQGQPPKLPTSPSNCSSSHGHSSPNYLRGCPLLRQSPRERAAPAAVRRADISFRTPGLRSPRPPTGLTELGPSSTRPWLPGPGGAAAA